MFAKLHSYSRKGVNLSVGGIVLQRFPVHFELYLITRFENLLVDLVVEVVLYHPSDFSDLKTRGLTAGALETLNFLRLSSIGWS